jgi:MSHA biogenesis protein MshK
MNLLIPQKIFLGILLSVANIFTAQAGTLKDPTQPPASLNSESNAMPAAVAGPVLQSVLIGAQTRAAIINGEKVMLGKKYQQATLIKLDEHSAVLRNPDMSTQTLVMDFAIEKKIHAPAVNAPANKRKVSHSSKPNAVKLITVSEMNSEK